MNTDLLITLQNYGFSEKEAKVYLTTLELGSSPASSIARRSEINRATVYTLLEEMTKKGIILYNDLENVKYYSPVHPENLLKKIEEKSQGFRDSLPSLVNLLNKNSQIKEAKSNIVEQGLRKRFTSETMRQEFKKIYDGFFKENDIVLSGTNVFTRGGGIGISGKFNLKQKLPTKSYVGIKIINNKPGVKFTKALEYDIITHAFKLVSFEYNDDFEEIAKYLEGYLKKEKYKHGLQISILAENKQRLGTGYISVSMSVLSVALSLLLKRITTATLQNYDKFILSSEFDQIHDLSTRLVQIPTKRNAYGSNNYITLINTELPNVYNYENFGNKKFFAKSIHSLFNLKKSLLTEIPFDYGTFVFGSGYDASMRIAIRKTFNELMSEAWAKSIDIFERNGFERGQLPEIFGELNTDGFGNPFQDVFTILKIQMILTLGDVLKYSYNEESIEKFFRTIEKYYQFSLVTELQDDFILLIKQKFEKYKMANDETLVIFPLSGGKTGGSFGFVMKHKRSRQTLQKVFEELIKEGHKQVAITYASWIDGTCADGVMLEKNAISGLS